MSERRRVMRLVNCRFPDPVYAEVQRAAAEFGVSAAQYIREATLMRLARREVQAAAEAAGTPEAHRTLVLRVFAELAAREADRLECPELAQRIREQYLE